MSRTWRKQKLKALNVLAAIYLPSGQQQQMKVQGESDGGWHLSKVMRP